MTAHVIFKSMSFRKCFHYPELLLGLLCSFHLKTITRTSLFSDNFTLLIITVDFNRKKGSCFLVLDVITNLKPFLVISKFVQKMFLSTFMEFTVNYLNKHARFCSFKQAWSNYGTFVSIFWYQTKWSCEISFLHGCQLTVIKCRIKVNITNTLGRVE